MVTASSNTYFMGILALLINHCRVSKIIIQYNNNRTYGNAGNTGLETFSTAFEELEVREGMQGAAARHKEAKWAASKYAGGAGGPHAHASHY